MSSNGRIRFRDKIEIKIKSAGSFTGTDYSHEAKASSLYAVDVNNLLTGLSVYIKSVHTPTTNSWTATYRGPNEPFGGYTVSGSTFKNTLSMSCVLEDIKAYATRFSKIKIVVGSIKIYVDDVLSTTLAGFDITSDAMGPIWGPIFSGLVKVEGGATAQVTTSFIGPPTYGSYDLTSSAVSTVSGGWRFMENGNWYSHDVILPDISNEAPKCGKSLGPPPPAPQFTICTPFDIHLTNCVISNNTWGNHINSVHSIHKSAYSTSSSGFGDHSEEERIGGSIHFIPKLARDLARINKDFGASIFRWATPRCQSNSSREIALIHLGGGGNKNGSTVTNKISNIVQHSSARAEEVFNDKSAIESMLDVIPYSLITVSHFKYVNSEDYDGSGNGHQDRDVEVFSFEYPYTVETYHEGTAPYMHHDNKIARYWNTVANPWWSYGYVSGKWNLYGSPTNWADYWGPSREQYLAEAKKRNSVITDTLEASAHTPFLDAFNSNGEKDVDGNPVGLRWVGMCRWINQTITPPTSVALDETSSTLWSVKDSLGSITFNHTNMVISSTVSELEVTLVVNTFDIPPYMYPSICDRIFLNWSPTNVSYIKVYSVGRGGHEELYKWNISDTATERNHIYYHPKVADNKYAGSWATDNGSGIADDLGTDSLGSGISSLTMSGSDTAENFMLTGDRTQTKIKFLIGFTSTASTVTLNYPTFYKCVNTKRQVWENGSAVATIFNDGPGVRLGNNLYYYGGINIPPLVNGIPYKSTVIDWLMDRRCLLESVHPYTGGAVDLTTELTQLYDTFEVQSIASVDGNTISSLLPVADNNPKWVCALTNGASEIPPWSAFAHNIRDSDWNEIPGSFFGGVWSMCQLPRKLVNSGNFPAILTNPSNTIQSTLLYTLTNWKVTGSEPIVDNYEISNWKVKVNSTEYAKVNPWHGYTSIIDGGGSDYTETGGVAIEHNKFNGEYWYAFVTSGNLFVGRSKFYFPTIDDSITQVTYSNNSSKPCLMFAPNGVLYIVYNSGSNVVYRTSTDQSLTWSSEIILFSGKTNVRSTVNDFNNDIVFSAFGYISGSSGPGYLYVIPYGGGDISLPSEVIAKDSTGANLRLADNSYDLNFLAGQLVLMCNKDGDSFYSHYCSKDNGLSFDKVF